MSDELVPRLRDYAVLRRAVGAFDVAADFTAAADALEAAQAAQIFTDRQRIRAEAERDAEAALADAAMHAIDLFVSDASDADVSDAIIRAQDMRAAHRERRQGATP